MSCLIRPKTLAVSVFVLFVFCSGAILAQTTIHVPADQPTIQGAINAANNGDTVLVAPGTYNENINFNGKAITVTSSGGAAATIINGSGNAPVVRFITSEANAVLNGFTIQNGGPAFYPYFDSGGIYIGYAASPTITNNIIQNNGTCGGGGGIGSSHGSGRIRGNIIQNNFQTGCSGGDGGGISLVAASSVQIIGNVIRNNDASNGGNGGGIALNGGTDITIANNIITGNVTGGLSPASAGGGISMINGPPDVLIVQNLIYNNTAGWGSGVFFSVGDNERGPLLVSNTIVGDPSASQGSVVYGSGFDAQVRFFNNLLIGFNSQVGVECAGTSPILTSNDAYSPNGAGLDGSCAGQSAQNGNISADAQFVNIAAGDFHLQAASPAIDAGTNSAPNLPQSDFAGNPRVLDGNNDCVSTVDLGAYELVRSANVAFSANSLVFGNQTIGTASDSRPVTLNNTGNTCFQFTNAWANGDFAQSNNCGAGVRGGSSCIFNVTFAPTALGTRLGTLSVAGSDGITTATPSVGLSGTGVDFAIVVNPNSATIKHAQSAKLGVSVSPVGGAVSSSVTLSCTGLPNGASCNFSPTSVTPGANGASSTLTLNTSGKTPRGTFTVQIIGSAGTRQHATALALTVN